MTSLFQRHRVRLDEALRALRNGRRAERRQVAPAAIIDLDGIAGRRFPLATGPPVAWLADDLSVYGLPLDVRYGIVPMAAQQAAAADARSIWGAKSVTHRVGVVLEIVARLEAARGDLARGLVHATGEPPPIAGELSVPVALERALMALAGTYERVRCGGGGGGLITRLRTPAREPLGWALPELVATLVAGNAALVQPDRLAVLPMALAVEVVRTVLAQQGEPPDLVQLVTDPVASRATTGTRDLAPSPRPRGGNPVIVDAVDDVDGVCRYLAEALLLCAGQRLARPQNVFYTATPATCGGHHAAAPVLLTRLGLALRQLAADPVHAMERRGALQDQAQRGATPSPNGRRRLVAAAARGIAGLPGTDDLIAVLDLGAGEASYLAAEAGPVLVCVPTDDAAESIERAAHGAATLGAAAAVVFGNDDRVVESAVDRLGHVVPDVAVNPIAVGAAGWPEGYGDEGLAPIDEDFVARHIEG